MSQGPIGHELDKLAQLHMPAARRRPSPPRATQPSFPETRVRGCALLSPDSRTGPCPVQDGVMPDARCQPPFVEQVGKACNASTPCGQPAPSTGVSIVDILATAFAPKRTSSKPRNHASLPPRNSLKESFGLRMFWQTCFLIHKNCASLKCALFVVR